MEREKTSLIERKDVISGTHGRGHSRYSSCYDAYGRFGDSRTHLIDSRTCTHRPKMEMQLYNTQHRSYADRQRYD